MRRRWLALVIGVVTVALPATATATADVSSIRIAGADRYGTAQAIATSTFTDVAVAVVATGENYPDSLASGYLTGANQGPVLLTPTSGVPQGVIDALNAVKAEGVQIVGGTSAVSAPAEAQLKDAGFTVTRIAGVDRYGTARAIANTLPAAGIGELGDAGRTAIIASGENFPDALAAGPLAHDGGFPLLLTPTATLSTETNAALDELAIENVVIMGGTAAVSNEVALAIDAKGITVRRVAGENRQATAAAIADLVVDELDWPATHVQLARGDAFPDALAGGPHAGEERGPILLTLSPEVLGAPSENWLTAHESTVSLIHVYGGTSAVTDATMTAARQAAGGT